MPGGPFPVSVRLAGPPDHGLQRGITGTPVFFINGRALRGAQPLEAFARMIDDELARTAGAAARAQ